jgi:hypothetical protein
VKYGLPCGSCYVGERDARNLRGVRLGKHERRILLSAPPGSKVGYRAGRRDEMVQPKIIYPDGPSRSDEEANRRALKKLEADGLIELSRSYTWQQDAEDNKKMPKWFQAKRYGGRYSSIDGLADDVQKPLGELFRQFGLWTGGVIFFSGLGAAFARTEEDRQRAAKRAEGAKRFQAFVLEKASAVPREPT